MQIIKLDATDSTNLYLKNLMLNSRLADYAVVVADHQTLGRGQMGTTWESEKGKNLTFSILKYYNKLHVQQQFMLNICVSLAIFQSLEALQIPDLKVKWPNDILSGNDKICGVLIENILSGSKIQASIIGIGLNINQINFDNLPNVSSLKLILGKNIALDEVLNLLILNLKKVFSQFMDGEEVALKKAYLNDLFRKDKPSTFKNQSDQMFTGIIRNISTEGKLIVEIEDEILNAYDLKEIKLLY
tara:strand:- start:26135 stop:26866 length:732 start_codon:yes stop_codon:yes gene_type:complete